VSRAEVPLFALPHDPGLDQPSIAASFADFRTHEVISIVQAAGPRTVETTAPAGGSTPTPDAERIERRHKLGKAGVITMLVGLGVDVVGTGVLVATAASTLDGEVSDSAFIGGALGGTALLFVGAVTSTVGEVMLFTGGIGASSLLDIPTTVGWIGVALSAGGLVVDFIQPVAGAALSVGGLVCGAVQLGQSGRAGREAGVLTLNVLPSTHGIRLAGTF
jgi:hypothetical protein